MPIKMSKAVVDAAIHLAAHKELGLPDRPDFHRISNQSYATIFVDPEGNERVCEIRPIAKAKDPDMSAQEILDSLIAEYEGQKAKAAARKLANAEKAAKDKKKRAEKEAATKAAEADKKSVGGEMVRLMVAAAQQEKPL